MAVKVFPSWHPSPPPAPLSPPPPAPLSCPSAQGGGHCLFEFRYPKQNYRPPVLCYHSPLSLSLLVYSPLFLRHQRKAYCYYCCYCSLPPVDLILRCPHTFTLITVAKTLTIANPGCFPWTSQANNYSPNRRGPSDSPPPESSRVPLFLAYSHSSGSPFCSGYPKLGSVPPAPNPRTPQPVDDHPSSSHLAVRFITHPLPVRRLRLTPLSPGRQSLMDCPQRGD